MEVPLKTKIELSYNPAIPLLDILQKKRNEKRYRHPNVRGSIIYNLPRYEGKSNVHQEMNGLRTCVYTQWEEGGA